MPDEQPGPLDAGRHAEVPKWRAPLLVAVLVAALFAALFLATGDSKTDLAQDCYQAFLSGRLAQTLTALDKYRERAEGDVPRSVKEELFQLPPDRFPIYNKKDDTYHADKYFVDRALFFCRASDQAFAQASDLRGAALHALGYVMRNVQSGGGPDDARDLVVTPLYVLCRGYAQPIESAWVMATLLRYRGAHACIIRIDPEPPAKDVYGIVGVLIDGRLYLFDPYRGVAFCRASDGRIADLETLLSGKDKLKEGFDGVVTLDALRKAAYLVPADAGSVLPDAWLLDAILRANHRPDVLYRSYRADLRNLAAAVFGPGTLVVDKGTEMSVKGRNELVALWDVPFAIDQKLADIDYVLRLSKVHRATAVYLNARHAQLQGLYEAARQLYDKALQEHPDDPEVVEDVTFFRASVVDPADRAKLLREYIEKYPAGRWMPLASLLLAEREARGGNKDAALALIAGIKPPYDLRARLLADAIRKGGDRVVWAFPNLPAPPPPKTPGE